MAIYATVEERGRVGVYRIDVPGGARARVVYDGTVGSLSVGPRGRTLAFVVGGMGSFYFATSSGLAAYDTTLLSAHMVQHMILSMVVPVFCALGAPVTLALRQAMLAEIGRLAA